MNRARIIFIILSLYILAAFCWWTYAHTLNNETIFEQKKELLEISCYKATFDIQENITEQLFDDTIGLRKYFDNTYPELEVVFLDSLAPLDNFMVRPKLSSYVNNELSYKRKFNMYLAEGAVMMLLLFWGMLVIYRSFKKELFLKKLQNNFLLSITHELKTPITAMKLYLETLLKRNVSAEQSKTIVENSLNEAQRLQDQVEKLLLSAQLDSHKYILESQSINLSELLTELVTNFNHLRPEHQKIKASIQDQVIVKGDPGALEMIINNLITNAIKYGGQNGAIEVTLKSEAKHAVLSVADCGDGIHEHDKKLLFNKFYRIGDENTRKTKGTGLGLFIVKHLVELHHGKISVRNNQPKGTIFDIKFNSDAE